MPLFPRWTNTVSRLSVFLLLAVPAVAIGGLLIIVRSTYGTKKNRQVVQPIQFDHRHHVGDEGIDCRYCHNTVEKSPSAGHPADAALCMNCHAQVWNKSPLLEPVRRVFFQDKPLQWKRVHNLPDFVYFNHAIHVNKGVGCVSCHGRVDQMAAVEQDATLTMGWCLDCHRHPEANLRPLGGHHQHGLEARPGRRGRQAGGGSAERRPHANDLHHVPPMRSLIPDAVDDTHELRQSIAARSLPASIPRRSLRPRRHARSSTATARKLWRSIEERSAREATPGRGQRISRRRLRRADGTSRREFMQLLGVSTGAGTVGPPAASRTRRSSLRAAPRGADSRERRCTSPPATRSRASRAASWSRATRGTRPRWRGTPRTRRRWGDHRPRAGAAPRALRRRPRQQFARGASRIAWRDFLESMNAARRLLAATAAQGCASWPARPARRCWPTCGGGSWSASRREVLSYSPVAARRRRRGGHAGVRRPARAAPTTSSAADVILSLDADFLERGPRTSRRPASSPPAVTLAPRRMNRLYVVEPA